MAERESPGQQVVEALVALPEAVLHAGVVGTPEEVVPVEQARPYEPELGRPDVSPPHT